MDRQRDSQRSKLYASENAVFGGFAKPPADPGPYVGKARQPLTQAEAQRIATRLADWLRSKGYAVTTPRVEITRRGTRATGNPFSGRIRLQANAPLLWILVHEMGHLVTGLPSGEIDYDDSWPWHGHRFAATYLTLVRHELGVDAHQALRRSMKDKRVRYTPPRTRTPVSDEQRAATAARLAANRRTASPHRYGFVHKPFPADLGPVVGVEVSRLDGIRSRLLPEPYTGPVYASSRVHDYVAFAPEYLTHRTSRMGTINPERAVTRTTVEALERWAANPYNYLLRNEWEIVDLADTLAAAWLCRTGAFCRTRRDAVARVVSLASPAELFTPSHTLRAPL